MFFFFYFLSFSFSGITKCTGSDTVQEIYSSFGFSIGQIIDLNQNGDIYRTARTKYAFKFPRSVQCKQIMEGIYSSKGEEMGWGMGYCKHWCLFSRYFISLYF